jgi:hypothetical protein
VGSDPQVYVNGVKYSMSSIVSAALN